MNCKPIANKDCSQCIDRFECPTLPLENKELDVKKCHVGTKTYNVGETILFKRKFCKYCSCVDVPLPPSGGNPDYEENGESGEDEDEDESTQTEPVADFNATAVLMNRPDPPKYNPLPLDTNYEARVTCAVSATSFTTIVNSPESSEYCFYKENECSGSKHCISKEKLEKGRLLFNTLDPFLNWTH